MQDDRQLNEEWLTELVFLVQTWGRTHDMSPHAVQHGLFSAAKALMFHPDDGTCPLHRPMPPEAPVNLDVPMRLAVA